MELSNALQFSKSMSMYNALCDGIIVLNCSDYCDENNIPEQ